MLMQLGHVVVYVDAFQMIWDGVAKKNIFAISIWKYMHWDYKVAIFKCESFHSWGVGLPLFILEMEPQSKRSCKTFE